MMQNVEHLTAEHDLSAFNSGEPELDEWLRNTALTAAARGLSRTFVLVDDGQKRVLGYYSLLAHSIEREELTRKLGRGLPAGLPAVLLAKLAVDQSTQGTGAGGRLLAEALARIAHAAQDLGARFVVVDALHEKAAAFYEHYGFTRVPSGESLRLVLRVDMSLLAH